MIERQGTQLVDLFWRMRVEGLGHGDEQGTGRKLSFLVQVSERSSEWSERLRLHEA